jgi:hypothetical protein
MAFATINKGGDYFVPVTYTGTGSSTSITTGFGPDLVWIKGDVGGTAHYWFDSVRGTGKNISSNSADAEVNWTGGPEGSVSAFNATSFSLSADTNGNANYSGRSYISWSWRASDSAAVSNTSGTITSTVSVNSTSGFSIVSYTGDGSSSATVGHGLGTTPKIVLVKSRSGGGNWMMFNGSGALNSSQNIALNLTIGADGVSVFTDGIVNPSSVTSSVFGFTSGSGGLSNVNGNGVTYVAYCFANVKGFSQFGYYTGNGSNDGPFLYTGFKPALFMSYEVSSGGPNNYRLRDKARSPYNVVTATYYANTSGAQISENDIDFVSNGIKIRNNGGQENESGATYVYFSFAENPFVLTDGTPVTAR